MVGEERPLRIIATPSGYQFASEIEHWITEKYQGEQGNAHPPVLVNTTFSRFADTDGKVCIDEHIRGGDVFIVADAYSHAAPVPNDEPGKELAYTAHTSPDGVELRRSKKSIASVERRLPLDVNFQQVLSTIDAAQTALKSSGRVTVILPCFPGARQDRRTGRESLDLRLRFEQLYAAGADHVLVLDPHNDAMDLAIQRGMSLDRLRASHTLLRHITRQAGKYDKNNFFFCAPDTGKIGVAGTKQYAQHFESPLGIVYKQRDLQGVNELKTPLGFLGDPEELQGRDVFIPDDMIDTGGTMISAAEFLRERGAKSVRLIATHPIFSYPALERFNEAYEQGHVSEVIVTNSVTLPRDVRANTPWLSVVDVTQYHAKVISHLHRNESISQLLETELR
jgi:ribose-phosphate pyrophosphokinase